MAATDPNPEAPKPPELGLDEFLTSVPPGTVSSVLDLMMHSASSLKLIRTPDLLLYCTNKLCGGERVFSVRSPVQLHGDSKAEIFLGYTCRNCGQGEKTFALIIAVPLPGRRDGLVLKIGEWPPFGPPTPSRVISALGPGRELFLKGRRAENQGLGIGAFTYYRRIVEDQKDRLLEQIIRAAKHVNAKPDVIAALEAAKTEQRFSEAMEMTKEAMPHALLIRGHNPLMLLHRALSVGVHNLSDEECLARARDVRVVLTELAERISQVMKDDAELKEALSHLLADLE